MFARSGRRRWITVRSTSSPLGSSVIDTSPLLVPGEGELAGRIELDDPALHSVLLAEAGRPLAGRIGQLVVAPDEFERRADLHLHLARRQPVAAQVAVGEIGPDALDRAGQKALDLQRGRLDQRAVVVGGGAFVIGRLLSVGGGGLACRPPRAGAARGHRDARSRSARRSSAIRGRWRAVRGRGGTVGAAAHLATDQSGVLERLDVLRGGRERDREGFGELADRALAARELAKHPPPRGVAEGVKDGIEFEASEVQPCG